MNKMFLSAIVGLCLAASVIASPVGTTIQSDIPLGQGVILVNKVATVITKITLDKGNWVISGSGQLYEQIPQTVTGAQTLNCSAWISSVEPFNHQFVFVRDSRQYTAFPFTGFVALPMAPKVNHFDGDTDLFLVVRSGFQNFGANAPNTATGFGYILATRVPGG
jgi:hypothetical protein